MARSTAANEDGSSEKAIGADDVSFNAKAIAGAWEAVGEQVPVCVAVAITNEFTDHVVTAADGVECDRDVVFGDAGVLFEEKAVGVCSRETAEQYAPACVDLERDDDFVLAINPAQIFDRPDFKHREDLSTTPDDEPEIVTDGGQDVVESLGELDEDAVYRYANGDPGSDRHTFTVNLDWIEDDDFADYGEGSVGFNYRDGYVADVPVSNVEEMIEDGRIIVESAADDPEIVTDGGGESLPTDRDGRPMDPEGGYLYAEDEPRNRVGEDEDPRFPRDDVRFDVGAKVWVDVAAWYEPDEIGYREDSSGRKGVEVVEDRENAGELVVEFRGEQRVVDRTAVIATDLETGEEVTIEYQSTYSESRQSKTATVSKILRSRGELGGSFDGLYVDIDDERTYYVGNSGVVKTTEPRRRIGTDCVVDRVESDG